MDDVKTTLPRLQVANKIIFGLGQLPISLIGMITHDHMAMKDMRNIPMNCGLMIPILQLGPCCGFFKLWHIL
jgi:hypothetical protein